MINLNKKYLPSKDFLYKPVSSNQINGFTYINPFIKDILIKKVFRIDFKLLYPKIICGLIELGYHENCYDNYYHEQLINYYDKLNYFLKNKDHIKKENKYKYEQFKIEINSFYGKLSYLTSVKGAPNYSLVITNYINNYFKALLNNNRHNIYYIDTDTIFCNKSIDLLDGIGIDYEEYSIEYIKFIEKKRYVYYNNREFKTYGINSDSWKQKIIKIKSDILKEVRNDTIDKILT